MYRAPMVILLVVLSFLYIGCGPRITPHETKVLVALDEIQRGAETNIDYYEFVQLLKTADAEINTLKQSNKKNPCFMGAVGKCYAAYDIARKVLCRI